MKKSKSWYLHETPNGNYYTLTAKAKQRYTVLGDGNNAPTPNQLKAFYDTNPDAYHDDGGIMCERSAKEVTHDPVALPGGFYNHEPADHSGNPERLVPIVIRTDTIIDLEASKPIIDEINDFMSAESITIDKELNLQHRHGILLYGPPGSGKTSLIRSILQNTVPKDAFVVFMDKLFSNGMIQKLKKHENDRFKVLVFEEMVTTVENVKMDALLDFLDGERSLDNTLTIGTTNYPEKLPANIVDRPGRFDSLYKIGDPNAKARIKLLGYYLSREATTEEVELTKDLSIASIKELCLVMRRKKKTMEESIKGIKKHRELVKKAFAESRQMGLSGRSSRDDDDYDD